VEKYDLVRTSTSYFTPSKPTLVNQKPYGSIRRYEDYSTAKQERPLTQTAPPRPTQDLSAGRIKRPEDETFPDNRGEYFASKNTELNEKIELIRRKYAAEREKLFTKFQSPQKAEHPQEAADAVNERRRASLGEFKDRPVTTRPYEFEERRYGAGRTDTKQENLRRTSHLESYG
jgi:hypothetical protein